MSKTKQPPKIYQLKISLNYIKPEIWRRFLVRSDISLVKLHNVIQGIMGWENCHLYHFEVCGVEYADPDLVDDEIEMGDASRLTIENVFPRIKSKCGYTYDFGDNWQHKIVLEKTFEPVPGDRYPLCVDGARSCPPEDCGGVGGYVELLRVLTDPEDEEYGEMKTWVGPHFDPEKFDPEIVNIGLPRRAVIKADDRTQNSKANVSNQSTAETGRTWISDLTHFLDENGLPPVNAPRDLREALSFFGGIVKASSSHPSNTQFCSALRCRTVLENKPCGGYLMISHRPDGVIHWQCPKCEEKGFISNWQKTIYDLSGAVEFDPSQRLSVLIKPDEYDLLREIITTSQEEDAIISGAGSTPEGMLLTGRIEDFDQLMGSIAFDANHSDGVRYQRTMDKLYGKIERVMDQKSLQN
ncbi:MAG: plasmid pRiA4b ORF-3 family protein [Armatimonadota bacterium]